MSDTTNTLVEQMKANLEKANISPFNQEEQYLFESIETLEDLYDFLDWHTQIGDWDQSEVFGLVLSLASETGKSGYDGEKPASDGYSNAVANLTILEVGDIVKLDID